MEGDRPPPRAPPAEPDWGRRQGPIDAPPPPSGPVERQPRFVDDDRPLPTRYSAADDRPRYQQEDRPRYQPEDRPRYQPDDRPPPARIPPADDRQRPAAEGGRDFRRRLSPRGYRGKF